MAKQKQKTKETKETQQKPKIQEQEAEKHTLVELVMNCPVESTWVIYNLSRKGLLEQYEQEIKDFGIKDIEPSLTSKEFDDIVNGK